MRRVGTVLAVLVVTSGAAAADDHRPDSLRLRPLSVADASLALSDASTTTAAAPSLIASINDPELLERRWPALPTDHSESEGDVMIDHLSELGNQLGRNMTQLSDQLIGLKVDGRGQRARLRVGTGSGHFLAFKLDSDWYFSDGKARINAHLELGVAGHDISVQLPAMEMERTSYHGDDGVMVKLPLFERRW
jgi:hypothetical protein